MSTSKLNVRKIEELAKEIKEEVERSPEDIDAIFISDLCRELNSAQNMLWNLWEQEAPTED